jgi:Zn-dependent peptidase ImmA (M78 family)
MKKVLKLVSCFADREDPPIDVDEVVTYLREHGVKDEINFVAADLNTEILRGHIFHFVIPQAMYRDPIFCADIYYAKSQTKDWQRLVCCKELLHILDPEEQRVKNKEELRRQFERIVLPAEFQDPIKDGEKVTSDRVATYLAVAVLFPWATRELFRPSFQAGKLTLEDIARAVDIPVRYVALVMHDRWERFVSLMKELAEKA